MKKIPKSLRIWFIIHFIMDILFGLPLLLFPAWTLQLFGFTAVETFTARLVGAALLGIGGVSLWMHNEGMESYRTMLRLKIIWSVSAIIGIFLSVMFGAPSTAWFFLAIFVVFSVVWIYFKLRLDVA